MKKLLFLAAFTLLGIACFSQFPNYQQFGTPTTLTDFKGAARATKGFVNGVFSDTTAANLTSIKVYPFAQIATSSDNNLWLRNSSATKWLISSGSSGGGNINIDSSVVSVSVLNDSTIIICHGDGTCDTLSISTVITNITNVSFLNDSTIIVCNGLNVCDTITIAAQQLFIAQNGLTQVVPKLFEWGGGLLHLTNISQNGHSVSFNQTNTGIFQIYDEGTFKPAQLYMVDPTYQTTFNSWGEIRGWLQDITLLGYGSPPIENLRSHLYGGVTINNNSLAGFNFINKNARFQMSKGADSVAKNNLTLGTGGNSFTITGNTQINGITNTNWQSGSIVQLLFTGTPTVKNNTAAGPTEATILLAGGVDFVAASGDILTLLYDGTNWRETTRKLAASTGGGSVTSFSSGNLSPIFTTSVATATTTPALTFALSSTGGTFRVFGSATDAAPTYLNIDTNYIATFSTKVRPLFSGQSPITFSSVTGVISADTSILATQYDLTQVPSVNIYNSDGTLTANRTVNQNGTDLLFSNATYFGASSNLAANIISSIEVVPSLSHVFSKYGSPLQRSEVATLSGDDLDAAGTLAPNSDNFFYHEAGVGIYMIATNDNYSTLSRLGIAKTFIKLQTDSLYLQVNGFGAASNGDVLTLVDNTTGLTAWVTPSGGSAPILPSTHIAFGNGTDPYTSTPDFVYSTDFGGAFNVGFSGTPVLQVAINSTIIGTGASEIAMGGNTIDLGDPFSAGNSTYLELDDLNRILLYKQGGNLYLKRDIANGIYADGDLSAALNSTTRTIDDVAKTITDVSDDSWLYKNVAGATFFSTTVATGTEAGFWGSPVGNATSIAWDDAAKKISLTSTTGTLLDLDGTTFVSQLVASDGTASATAYLKADLLGTGVEFNINAYDGGSGQVTIAGNAITNILELIAASTGISIDGSAAQTITLTAANGILVNTGIIRGDALHDNAFGQGDATQQDVRSGTYTPTLTNVTNIAASTAYECQWIRVGNVVTVSGKVDIDVTLGAASELGLSLPIASAMTADENLGGTASSAAAASLVSAIRADATNDRAAFVFTAVSLTNDSYAFEFTYLIK